MRSDELITNPHPFLEGMDREHLRLLSDVGDARELRGAGSDLSARRARRPLLPHSGQAASSLRSRIPGRGQITIQTIGSGEALGWSWLFEPYTWHFDAFADEPTRALYFHASLLREQCEQDPKLGYELMKRISRVVIHRLQATRLKLLRACAAGGVEI